MGERTIGVIKEAMRIICHKNNISLSDHEMHRMAETYYIELYDSKAPHIETFVTEYTKGIIYGR